MRHKIGLVYLPGALPCFEAFGNLPTHLVREDGLVEGKAASEALDMIVIPGGSLVESRSVKDHVAQEVLKMAEDGKFVLGICSGFQILSKGTDIGRLSPMPIFREGLGLLDVEFKPLICTDQVKATVVGTSDLTDEVGAEVSGFHCHTYGDIVLHKQAKTILVSQVAKVNYFTNQRDLVSGISNSEGNVVGTTIHALLDQNPLIIRGITKSLDISVQELDEIRTANAKLQQEIKGEIGISTNIHAESKKTLKGKTPHAIILTALESGSGKTLIATGLAGALKRKGINVGVIKIGGDIRDSVPALYLIKEPMRNYASIRVVTTGWKSIPEAIREASRDYEFLIIEGAMNAFTGLLYSKKQGPNSTAEAAAAIGAPTIVVAGCDKEGVEGGLVDALNHVHLLKELGVKVAGVVLNKVHPSYLTEENLLLMNQAFANAGVELLGTVPRVDLVGRGAIPEVEIKYEDFGAKALELAEKHLNLKRILQIAAAPDVKDLDFGRVAEKFRESLLKNYKPDSASA